MGKRMLGTDVLSASRARIARTFADFPRVYASFSGGKDSSVMVHLTAEEARRRGRRFGLLFVDLEAQYRLTIEHIDEMFARYADVIDPYWLALPLVLRNAVSQYEPRWMCWEPGREADWVRKPPGLAITAHDAYPWFRVGMEFEELVVDFGRWYAGGEPCVCLVGIRTAESLNRWRTIASTTKATHAGLAWTTQVVDQVYNAYPIYDWRTEDIWTYNGRFRASYNRLYDRMHQAGLTIHQARICQPYGDDQRRGLWLFQVIEPETWARVVARVNGANQGALYVRERGNIMGYGTISKPPHLTWREFAELLLASMPERTAEHFRNKIAVFIRWWQVRGHDLEDDGPVEKGQPNWRRVCKALLRQDYWCKGLSFSQTKTTAYARYQALMQRRREEWQVI